MPLNGSMVLSPPPPTSDISHLNWINLQAAGVSYVVFDKDNCLTEALQDGIVAHLEASWVQCTSMGFKMILIVSNSSGSSSDPLGVGAEHLARVLGQPVLAHPSKKPANACAKQVINVLAQYGDKDGHILVVGDRITTDIILASRMQRHLSKRSSLQQVIGVLTTAVHAPERLGTRVMRGLEMWTLHRLTRSGVTPGSGWRGGRDSSRLPDDWQSIATGVSTLSTSASIAEITHDEEPALRPTSIAQSVRAIPSRVNAALFLTASRSLSWLGAGWHLINDGIRLGTKGFIGAPDPSLKRTRRRVLGDPRTRGVMSSSPFLSQQMSATLSRTPHRLYSSQQHRPVPASPFRLRGWPSAVAALALLPTGWYGGLVLHEWLNPEEGTGKKAINKPSEDTGPHRQTRPETSPPSLASQPAQQETLLTAAYHLRRELSDLDEKLERLRQRNEQTSAAPS